VKCYFRSVVVCRKARDATGRIIPYQYEFIPPRELELDLPKEVADSITEYGMLNVDMPDSMMPPEATLNDWQGTKLRLDVVFGYCTEPGEILTRDVAWLNARCWAYRTP
jgi:hypothetical protein